MALSKSRSIAAMLALPAYSWISAVSSARFHFDFLPATDIFVSTVLAAFGLIPKKDEGA